MKTGSEPPQPQRHYLFPKGESRYYKRGFDLIGALRRMFVWLLLGAFLALAASFGLSAQGMNLRLVDRQARHDAYDPSSFAPQVVSTVPAAPEQVARVLQRPPPIFVTPVSGRDAPTIEVLAPFRATDAKSVTITKVSVPGSQLSDPDRNYPSYYLVEISGKDVPFYVPLIQGATTVDINVEKSGKGDQGFVDLRYRLDDGRFITGRIGADRASWEDDLIGAVILTRLIAPRDSDGNSANDWRQAVRPSEVFDSLPSYVASNALGPLNTPRKTFDLGRDLPIVLFRLSGAVTMYMTFDNHIPDASARDLVFPLNFFFRSVDGRLLSLP